MKANQSSNLHWINFFRLKVTQDGKAVILTFGTSEVWACRISIAYFLSVIGQGRKAS
jgi:hypothetical protein